MESKIMQGCVHEIENPKTRAVEIKCDRIYFIDNLKIFLIILVIIHHVGQAYGPTGGFWQYKSSLNESIPWLGSFFAVNASFFMGLFFMISGYFIPYSYDRKGGRAFLTDKLVRYGLPLLFGFFIIQPLEMYFYYSHYSGNLPVNFWTYFQKIYLGIGERPEWFKDTIGWPERSFGHLWFIEHLLVYSVIYGLFRRFFPQRNASVSTSKNMYLHISVITLFIMIFTAIVRTKYPIDIWIGILGFLQSEVAHLPQYAVLFITGIIAYRKNWFMAFHQKIGYAVFTVGLIMAGFIYFHSAMPQSISTMLFANWAFYETLMAMCLCWGLIVFFRGKINGVSPIRKFLSENAYAAYIFHFPVVLILQFTFDKMDLGGAVGKFLVVSMLSITVTFVVSYLIRKIPYAGRII